MPQEEPKPLQRNPIGGLPLELVRDSNAREVAQVLLAGVIVTVLANFAAYFYLEKYPLNKGYEIVDHKWTLLRSQQKPVDTLLLGDSSCNQGIDPKQLGEALGGSALNLCTIGNALVVEDAWMLEEYLQKVGKPKRVVLAHVYDVWWRDTAELENFSWIISKNPRYFTQAKPELDMGWRGWFYVPLGAYVPLYTQNASLQAIVFSPGQFLGKSKRPSFAPLGYMPVAKSTPKRVRADIEEHVAFAGKNKPELSSPNLAAFAQIVKLCKEHNIPLYLVPAPMADELWENATFQAYFKSLQAKIEAQAKALGGAKVVSSVPPRYPVEVMENADHLIATGAAKYTAWVAESIR